MLSHLLDIVGWRNNNKRGKHGQKSKFFCRLKYNTNKYFFRYRRIMEERVMSITMIITGVICVIYSVVGTSTNYWHITDGARNITGNAGFWKSCVYDKTYAKETCFFLEDNIPTWFQCCRILAVLACVAALIATCFACLSRIFFNKTIFGFITISFLLAFLSWMTCISMYATKAKKIYNVEFSVHQTSYLLSFGWSYGVGCFGCISAFFGLLFSLYVCTFVKIE